MNRSRSIIAAAAACLVLAGCGEETAAPQDLSPSEQLARLAPVEKASPGAAAPNIRGSGTKTVEQFLASVASDVGAYWEREFERADLDFAPVRVSVITGTQETACRPEPLTADERNAFYCPPDPAILLPTRFFSEDVAAIGDAAVAIVVAHEWGHRVQDLLGFLAAEGAGRLTGRQIELQADCFAGIWTSTVLRRGLLEQGDLEEAIAITNAAGDALNTPAELQHGSAAERVAAFRAGYAAASPGLCDPSRFAA